MEINATQKPRGRTMWRKRKDKGIMSVTTMAKVDTIPLIALLRNKYRKESHTLLQRP
jgi:hypothetical protein